MEENSYGVIDICNLKRCDRSAKTSSLLQWLYVNLAWGLITSKHNMDIIMNYFFYEILIGLAQTNGWLIYYVKDLPTGENWK